jgi:hypothetical protein
MHAKDERPRVCPCGSGLEPVDMAQPGDPPDWVCEACLFDAEWVVTEAAEE